MWEDRLEAIVTGEETVEGFLGAIDAKLAVQLAALRNTNSAPLAAGTHACPACSKALRRIKGKNGFFWGCSGYPDCKSTLDDARGKPTSVKSVPKSAKPARAKAARR